MADPTPAEIRKACEEIRATWTPSEMIRRTAESYRPKRPTVPGCKSHTEILEPVEDR
jgi:hypothetical protein